MVTNLAWFLVLCVAVKTYAQFEQEAESETDNERPGRKPPCVFIFNSSDNYQGEILSPNYPSGYPNNLNCRYEFHGRQNERVLIQVEDFNLEAPKSTREDLNAIDFVDSKTRKLTLTTDSNERNASHQERSRQPPLSKTEDMNERLMSSRQCFYDYLDVFTVNAQGRLFWRSRHCGSVIDAQIVSTSPTLILVFKTDRMLSFRGFKFSYRFSYINILPFVTDPQCGPSEIVGNGSVISSPNYPNYIPYNIECAWTVTVEKNQNILIKFIDVNLNQPCHVSHINLWDGYVNDVKAPDLTVCEKLLYYHKGVLQFKTKSNRLVIKFVANKYGETKSEKGLKAAIRKEKINEFMQNKTTTALKSGNDVKYGFQLSWTGIHLQDNCGPGFYQCEGGEYCIDSKKFLCQMTYKYCISDRLVCDGVFNCDFGDQSDEALCHLNMIKQNPVVVAVGSALALSIIIVCIKIFCCCCARKQVVISENQLSKSENGDVNKVSVKYDKKGRLKRIKKDACCCQMCWPHVIEAGNNREIDITRRPSSSTSDRVPTVIVAKKSPEGFETVELYTSSFRNTYNLGREVQREWSEHSLSNPDLTANGNLKRNSSFQRAMYIKVDT